MDCPVISKKYQNRYRNVFVEVYLTTHYRIRIFPFQEEKI